MTLLKSWLIICSVLLMSAPSLSMQQAKLATNPSPNTFSNLLTYQYKHISEWTCRSVLERPHHVPHVLAEMRKVDSLPVGSIFFCQPVHCSKDSCVVIFSVFLFSSISLWKTEILPSSSPSTTPWRLLLCCLLPKLNIWTLWRALGKKLQNLFWSALLPCLFTHEAVHAFIL